MKKIHIYFITIMLVLNGFHMLCFAEEMYDNEGEAIAKEDIVNWHELATKYIGQKDYAGAVAIYNLLLKEFPNNADIYYLRGILTHQLGRVDEAKNDYQFLIDHGAADGTIFNNLGVLYAANEEFEQAYYWFNYAIREEPGNVEAHDNLAELFLRGNEYDDAIPAYNKVIEIEQNNVRALYNLGVTYAKIGDYEKAQKQWERILEINPEDYDIEVILEQTRKQQKALKKKEN